MHLKALIVDDEPPARQRIRALLEQEADIEVTGECENAGEALLALRKRGADLVFLDVQMPEVSGFELLKRLPRPWPAIIFVTAFNEHAVAAFEVHALDYLLKPFSELRFRTAVARAREQLARKSQHETAQRLETWIEAHRAESAGTKRLAVRDRDRLRFVNLDDISWVEASGNYVVIHAGRDKHVLRESLTSMEARLPAREFFRINRRTVVRLAAVAEVVAVERDEHVVVLKSEERLPLSCAVREIVARMLA